MLKVKSSSFTIIEVLIVVAIIVFMATIFARFIIRKPETDWSYVLRELNNVTYLARQESITKSVVHRFSFVIGQEGSQDYMILHHEEDDPEKPFTKIYVPTIFPYLDTMYKFPENIHIKALIVNGKNLFKDSAREASIYITVEGLIQSAELNLEEIKEGESVGNVVFIMQPFLGKWKLLEPNAAGEYYDESKSY